ncbi:MAG: glycoside hydrolase family 16 protein [Spirochaetales bacterium]|nr:glycoside hydrolase family 16 protein [Spirochaetales bacterium]
MKKKLKIILIAMLSVSSLISVSCAVNGPYSFELNLATSTGTGTIDTTASTADGVYEDGSSVTAKAIPDNGSVFAGWYTEPIGGRNNEKISGSNPYTFDISDNMVLYAAFVKRATNTDDYDPDLTGWTLAWSDEFNDGSLNMDVWSREVRGPAGGELQTYTDSENNSIEEDGYLVLKAEWTGNYNSARVISNPGGDYPGDSGSTGQLFRYGKIAARIQLPYGKGIWPAFWMLGDNVDETGGNQSWPGCGEIDIAETGSKYADDGAFGHATTGQVIHYDSSLDNTEENHAYRVHSETAPAGEIWGDKFHVFEIEWDETQIVFKIDDVITHTQPITDANLSEFRDKDFYVLFNIAVGGSDFTYTPDGTAIFPQYMFVDWIRYYTAN